jgi:DNA modification methylase
MTEKLTVKYRPVSELVPYVRNARTHSDEQVAQLAGSIKEFGWTNPILVDNDGGIIAGHGRLLAAQRLKMDEVPTIQIGGLSEAQRRALVLADNKLALNAGWDIDLLKVELSDLNEQGFDIALTGFSVDEISKLLAPAGTDGLTDQDDTPEVPVNPVSKLGDVWVCGPHRVMCGSSLEQTAVDKLCAGQAVDMLLTDPPYNVSYTGKTKEALTIKNDKMEDEEFRAFLRDAFVTADVVMRPGAVFYIWHPQGRDSLWFRLACEDAGWNARQTLIWKKSSMVLGRSDYHQQHEPCLYGWKEGAGHFWASDRKQTTILEFDRPSRSKDHPTMKPVALFEYQLLNNTKGGDIVLDSFGGSGTTLLAAEKNGRVARLMELDPKYVDVIVQRWQEFTGKQATLESDGRTFAECQSSKKKD